MAKFEELKGGPLHNQASPVPSTRNGQSSEKPPKQFEYYGGIFRDLNRPKAHGRHRQTA